MKRTSTLTPRLPSVCVSRRGKMPFFPLEPERREGDPRGIRIRSFLNLFRVPFIYVNLSPLERRTGPSPAPAPPSVSQLKIITSTIGGGEGRTGVVEKQGI